MSVGLPVLVFDGDCGFCTRCAAFARRRMPGHAALVAYQRIDLSELGLTPDECDAAVQWVDASGVRSAEAALVAYARTARNPVWRTLGRLLDRPWLLQALHPAYVWVAGHRALLPGGTGQCRLDTPNDLS